MNLQFNIKIEVNKEETIERAKMVLFKSMLKLHELAVHNCPVDTGRLRSTLNIFPMSFGSLKYVFSDGTDYGIHIEYGTSPHYVSAKRLKGWSSRVLGNPKLAYAVAGKIAKFGVNASPFARPAIDQVKRVWIKRYWQQEFR